MARISAGLLMYRWRADQIEVLLVHPGGPFWSRKDSGAWSIPKGACDPGEDLLDAAKREFNEETGLVASGPFDRLSPRRQSGGKLVHAWAFAGDGDAERMVSNTFTMEWPPGSGRVQEYPEVDRAAWFDLATARRKINPAQAGFLDDLVRLIGARGGGG